jgi:hypothetical protein
MNDEARSVLLGTAGLGAAAVAAAVMTVARGLPAARGPALRAAVRVGALALVVQAAHFAEELATGFQRRFPEVLGLTPWSDGFFVSFNLAWLAVWGLALRGLAARREAALWPLWFLGIAGVANGIAHPLLAARTGAYFPGLVTSPVLGVVGLLLLRRLLEATVPRPWMRQARGTPG